MSTTDRYIIRFAVHIDDVYRRNYLNELAENTGSDTRELSDGSIEIAGSRSKESGWVLDALKQEERRGALVIIEKPTNHTFPDDTRTI